MKRHFIFIVWALFAIVCSCKKEKEPKFIPIQKITINNGEDLVVEEYSEATITAVIEPANATESIQWAVSNGKIFYFASQEGLSAVIHALYMVEVKDFTAQVWAVSEGNVMSNVITATNHPHKDEIKSLILEYAQKPIKQGSSTFIGVKSYEPIIGFFEMGDIVWTSDDPSIIQIEAVDEKTAKVTAAPNTKGSRVDIHATCGKATYRCTMVVVDDVVEATGVKLDKSSVDLYEDGTVSFMCTVSPSGATDKSVSWHLSKPGIVTIQSYSSTHCTIQALKPGTVELSVTTATGKVDVATVNVIQDPVPSGAVDLGYRICDRAVYWSTKNLGANYDVDMGDYYAWGDPEPYYMSKRPFSFKTGKEGGYTDKNYKYYKTEGDNVLITKYVNKASESYSGKADGNIILEKKDDPASVILGGYWRSPSLGDISWLLSNCRWEDIKRSGIPGYLVTSTVKGFEGQSIFLPYTGYMVGTECVADGTVEYFNGEYKKIGTYQTSTLNLLDPKTRAVVSFFHGDIETRYYSRAFGCAIRPVCSRQ